MDSWMLRGLRAAACAFIALSSAPALCLAQQPRPTTPARLSPEPPTDLSAWLVFVLAAGTGAGIEAGTSSQTTAQAGVKLGLPVSFAGEYPSDVLRTCTLDLAYDRVHGRGGFSTELSIMLPVVRYPGPQADEKRNYLRIYFEPGVGYHAGGTSGGYGSAKVMMVLLSDRRLTSSDTPASFLRRDPTPTAIRSVLARRHPNHDGVIFAACNHCGLD